MLKVVILLMLCVACGKSAPSDKKDTPPGVNYSPIYSDSDTFFQDYTDEFLFQYMTIKGSAYFGELPPINFHDLKTLPYLNNSEINISKHFYNENAANSTTMAGVCLAYPNGKREILIDQSVWNTIGQGFGCNTTQCYERRMTLVFHELGHCLLDRPHKDDKYLNYNISLMNSILLRQNDIVRWQNEYFEELFTEDSSNIQDAILIYDTSN